MDSQKDVESGHSNKLARPRKITLLEAHLIAASSEFVGTFMFLYIGYMGQVMLINQESELAPNRTPSAQRSIFAALIYGFSLLVNVWAFFRISGGLFNPAVTFAMVLSGQMSVIRALFMMPAQLIAAMCAAGLVSCMIPGDIGVTNTTLGEGTSIAQGVFIEMFMTAELVFVVLMLAAEKSKDTFIAPIGIGLALFVLLMASVNYTSGSLNPARSFGSAIASTHFPGYHWIYWVGPFLGGMLAAGFYRLAKYFNYEQVNPGQDATEAIHLHTRPENGREEGGAQQYV
ncbi:aquaporin [Periconia macrospinosa]|uniref:Aquaporin n=1 Tax=Periconia macrospinosa TaxID=97972 RepID=A0A2V1E6A9_9PLEO|nr:aquaporin [Periconia macrospinosa]